MSLSEYTAVTSKPRRAASSRQSCSCRATASASPVRSRLTRVWMTHRIKVLYCNGGAAGLPHPARDGRVRPLPGDSCARAGILRRPRSGRAQQDREPRERHAAQVEHDADADADDLLLVGLGEAEPQYRAARPDERRQGERRSDRPEPEPELGQRRQAEWAPAAREQWA